MNDTAYQELVSTQQINSTCTWLLLSEGYAAGPHYNEGGSGSNFLCLHEDPQWRTYREADTSYAGSIYGVEYQLQDHSSAFSRTNNAGNSLYDGPAPCAVCYVGGRSTILMVPARTQCPDGWTTEYGGWMVSERGVDRKRSSYICWDEAPEVAIGPMDQDQALAYVVEVHCGTLPCSVYHDARELTCVVCSK